MSERTRFDLTQEQLPAAWFNIMPAIAQSGIQPLPPLHPGTLEPVTPDLLAPLFPEALIMQEVSTEERIDIPGPVLDIYRLWRPSPLQRATRLERALETPAHIYYKYEGVSPAGSHKPNTAVAQAPATTAAKEVVAASARTVKYCPGSVLIDEETHQTIREREGRAQMKISRQTPDVVDGCLGSDANYAALCNTFIAN